ncbi:OprD family outer membrane porin [Acinetobacter puyangensis]|uniref:OprD family outer membrane porin n=1 Tax=Acinetobacter puyangensis TaxID=1096779 RepID=UPI003A4E53B2
MKRITVIIMAGCVLPLNSQANDFIEQSTASLTSRNYYLDRNFTNNNTLSGAQDWAQGFIFNFKSGYTEGKIGVGLDIQSLTSIKLHADPDYLGSGLLPTNSTTRERSNTASEIGITAKLKYQDTELKAGTVHPWNPVIFGSVSRLLPQTFQGISFDSKDFDNLELTAGYIEHVNHRDSTNHEDLSNIAFNGRFKAASSDHFNYIGGKYQFSPSTQTGLYYAIAKDIYEQSAFTFKKTSALQDHLNLITDIRLWNSQENGQALAGKIDNTLLTANLGFNYHQHTLTLSTMQNFGSTAHPYLSGGEVLIFIDGWSTDFLNPKEKVYAIRYDYDFKSYIPGLKFMTRYTRGDHINLPHLGGTNLHEDSLDFDLHYVIPTGKFKGLGLRGRYGIYDNNFSQNATFKPAHETRINIDYTWKFK